MFRLPTYDVVLWYWVCPETAGYREKFINTAEAKAILERLKPFISDPNIVLLRLGSTREDFEPITCKDERPSKRTSTLGHA